MNNELLTIITANQKSKDYWKELWRFKDLFLLLAWRDILVRYKQTLLGVAWAILRPLITVIVFTFVFGKLAKLPSGEIPYVIFVFAGMLPWLLFATAITEAGNSLVSNANIITKIYFPRLLVPLSSIAVCFIDTFIAGVIFLILMWWYGVTPNWHIVLTPIFMVWLLVLILGVSLWITTLNVTYRDFRYLIPFIVQLGMYISPVGFSSEIVPEKWLWLFYLNPMVGIIDGFRWCFLGGSNFNFLLAIPSVIFTILICITGVIFFRKKEDSFADGI